MQGNHKPVEPEQAVSSLLAMLWDMTLHKDLPRFLIEAPASVEITTATVEYRGLRLSALEREVELAWEVRIKGRV